MRATAINRTTNTTSSDADDDILANSLVLVRPTANRKRELNLRAQKDKQTYGTMSQSAHGAYSVRFMKDGRKRGKVVRVCYAI